MDSEYNYGLDFGLDYGLDFKLDSKMYKLTSCFRTFQASPPSHHTVVFFASSLVPKIRFIQIPMHLFSIESVL